MTVGTRPQIDRGSATPRRIRLHPISFLDGMEVVVALDADHLTPSIDCIELIMCAWPEARVTRREGARGLVDDPVLAGRDAPPARFVAH